jgi:ornithine cyclodeaminase/alanine dehydrogenase-like protein (mu-crystallin family)
VNDSFVFLDESKTAALLSMAEVVRTCELALAEMGAGGALLSVPPAMLLEGGQAPPVVFKVKGGHLRSLDACGFRVVGDVGQDGAMGESHFCYLLDPKTAAPRALVAHTAIHRMRTAACGLIALKALAPSKASTLALIGAGKIGSQFAAGFGEVFPGKRLLIASRNRNSAVQLAAKAQSKSARVVAADSVESAVRDAQSVVVITSSASPVLSAEQFKPGLTIIGMGEHHELPVELLKKADRFVVDDIGFASVLGSLGAWIQLGQVSKGEAETRVVATLGAILAGRAHGREADSEKILCIVQGLAIADIALAELCRRKVLGLA